MQVHARIIHICANSVDHMLNDGFVCKLASLLFAVNNLGAAQDYYEQALDFAVEEVRAQTCARAMQTSRFNRFGFKTSGRPSR